MTNYRFVVLPRLRLAMVRSFGLIGQLGLIGLLTMPLAPLQAQGLKAATLIYCSHRSF